MGIRGNDLMAYALRFDGVNDHTSYSDSPQVSSFSYEFKCSVASSYGRPCGYGTGSDGHRMIIWQDGNSISFRGSPIVSLSMTGIDITLSNKYKITGDGTNLRLYVNDVLKDTKAYTGQSLSCNAIGVNANAYHNGDFEYFKYQDLATPANDYTFLLDDGTGSTATDSSGNGNDATLVNFPTDDSQWIDLGGGTTHEESITLSSSMSQSDSVAAIFEPSLTINMAAGYAASADLTAEAALALAATLGDSYSIGTVFSESLSLSMGTGQSQSAVVTFEPSITLGISQNQQLSIGDVFNESVTLGSGMGQSIATGAVFEGSTMFSISQGDAVTAQAIVDVSVTFGAQLDQTQSGGMTYESVLTLSAALAQSVSGVIALGAPTPIIRTVLIESENRIVTIKAESRIIKI